MTITKQDELIAKLVDLAGGVDKLEEALREVARLTGRTPKVDEVVAFRYF